VHKLLNRRTLTSAAVGLIVVGGLVAVAGASTSDVTKARLERSLPVAFSNVYVQQAKLLGHKGITVGSLHAKASCDKGGPKAPDHGPGSDWLCLMSWSDPNVPLPDGTARFELNVHSNDCYTAGGPSKFIGPLTITDAHGKDVDNPVFEFDVCFDPHTSNTPTGVSFDKPASASLTPTQQAAKTAAVTLPSGQMAAGADGKVAPSLVCSPGKDGCAGTLTATAEGKTVSADYIIGPDDHAAVTLPLPRGTTGPVKLTASPVIGAAAKSTSTFTLVADR
jgi:hypothetical protein